MDKAERFIFGELWSDFKKRKLVSSDLQSGYEGPKIEAMKSRASDQGIDEVDFDVAIKGMEESELIKTGPWDITKPLISHHSIVMPFPYSKREYASLTERGYKEASKAKSFPVMTPRIVVHGDQYNIEHAAAVGSHSTGTINNQPQWTAIQNQVDLGALTSELEKLRLHLAQSALTGSDYAQLQLVAEAKDAAAKQDGNKVMEFLSKGGKTLLDAATDFGAKLTAELIAKQSGLS